MSNSIHSALDAIAGFWSSSSSIGAGGDGVGLHSVDNRGNRRDSIRARDHLSSRINAEDAIITGIATQIGKELGFERQNGAVLANSGLHAGMETPAMTHRDDIVLATLQPSYRSLQLLRQECRHDLFTTESGLAAKGSPYMRNSDLDVRWRHVQRCHQLETSQPDRLTGDPDRESPISMPFSNNASRFHRYQCQTWLPHVQRDNLISLGEPRFYIANRLFSGHSNIALLIEDLRPVLLERGIESSYRGQHLVININEFGSFECCCLTLGHHCGHRFTGIVDLHTRHGWLRHPCRTRK